MYYLQTDPQHSRTTGRDAWIGGRVNLAIVTAEEAAEVRVIENPMYNPSETNNAYRLRRALGVRIGNTVYYNMHARGRGRRRPAPGHPRRDPARRAVGHARQLQPRHPQPQ
ncbi:hypothetical protein [Streptomyces sp. NRRL S-920]|uniref:hypothetical protein n=1 Tax=Streptomyces sp. NRRL S-920 TaxID=1463921 RepID=UPI000ACF7976|nr:hypothetical protein [Streptomyces sp. NRRL S-920]